MNKDTDTDTETIHGHGHGQGHGHEHGHGHRQGHVHGHFSLRFTALFSFHFALFNFRFASYVNILFCFEVKQTKQNPSVSLQSENKRKGTADLTSVLFCLPVL
jgi:hypothetical protein